MGVKLTNHQLTVMKKLVEFCEASANQIYRIMVNHGLDKIEGCNLKIDVDPSRYFTTMLITAGDDYTTDFGHAKLARGKKNERYALTDTNSAEYELLFADEAVRSRMEKIVHGNKPLPPDGLWVGDHRNSDPVDGWEWDLNDSLS